MMSRSVLYMPGAINDASFDGSIWMGIIPLHLPHLTRIVLLLLLCCCLSNHTGGENKPVLVCWWWCVYCILGAMNYLLSDGYDTKRIITPLHLLPLFQLMMIQLLPIKWIRRYHQVQRCQLSTIINNNSPFLFLHHRSMLYSSPWLMHPFNLCLRLFMSLYWFNYSMYSISCLDGFISVIWP